MEISELRRIATFVFDQRGKLREEEKERKETEKEREKDRKRRTERMEDLRMFAAMQNDRRHPNPPPSDNQPRCSWCKEMWELGIRCPHCFRRGRRGHLRRDFPGPRTFPFPPPRAPFHKGPNDSNGRENPKPSHHIQFKDGFRTL